MQVKKNENRETSLSIADPERTGVRVTISIISQMVDPREGHPMSGVETVNAGPAGSESQNGPVCASPMTVLSDEGRFTS